MDKISASFPGTTVSLNYLKKLRGLRQKKYRGQARLFLAEGVRLCEEAQRSTAKIDALIFNPDQVVGERMQNILQRAGLKNIPIYQASEKDFSSISETGTWEPFFAPLNGSVSTVFCSARAVLICIMPKSFAALWAPFFTFRPLRMLFWKSFYLS